LINNNGTSPPPPFTGAGNRKIGVTSIKKDQLSNKTKSFGNMRVQALTKLGLFGTTVTEKAKKCTFCRKC